jgi:hypothetical protein
VKHLISLNMGGALAIMLPPLSGSCFDSKQLDGKEADNKAANVGEPCHAAGIGKEYLHEKPQGKQQYRGNLDGGDEDEDEDECFNLCPRKEEKISAQDARYCTACPNHWYGRAGVIGYLCQGCRQTTESIKEHIFQMTQCFFHIVAKYPQIEHVPSKVKDAAVEKH